MKLQSNLNKKLLALLSIFSFVACALGNTHDKIIIIAPPKSGVHLVADLVTLLTQKQGVFNESCMNIDNTTLNESFLYLPNSNFACTHIFYNDANLKKIQPFTKIIFVKRDPRDCLLSFVRLMKQSKTWQNAHEISEQNLISHLTRHFTIVARGWDSPIFQQIKTVGNFLEQYAQWTRKKNVHIVTYENLLGVQAEQASPQQLNEILALSRYLQVPLGKEKIQKIALQLNQTMHEESHSWHTAFSEQNKLDFKQHAQDILTVWGYEKDANW